MESVGTVISSIVASSGVVGILGWLSREWISARLKKSIQHEYDVELEKFKVLQQKELEGYKAGYKKALAENEIRFSWWHEEKAKAIKDVYNDLAELTFCLQYMQSLETDPRWQIEGREQVRSKLISRFVLNIEQSAEKWLRMRLFLGDMEDQKICEFRTKTDQLFALYASSIMSNTTEMLKEEGWQVLKDINDITEFLRHRFQDILQGRDDEK